MVSSVHSPSAAAIRMHQPEMLRRWLIAFAEAVRARDIQAGRALFAPEVVAFGTHAAAVVGLDALAQRQWSHIWNRTRGFTFDFDHFHASIEGDFAWIAATWQSQGIHSDGGTFLRSGRATYLLRLREGRWLAIHSHHSLNPASPHAENSSR